MQTKTTYRDSELYRLLYSTFPRLRRIEEELAEADPALISLFIRNEPESVFVLDYYFRLFTEEIGARIINARVLDVHGLAELFNCRVVQFLSDNPDLEKPDFSRRENEDAYWRLLEDDRRLELFERLTPGYEDALSAALLLRDMSPGALNRLYPRHEARLVELFQDQALWGLFSVNPDLYDCVYGSFVRRGDIPDNLNHFLRVTVDVRLAQSYSAELRANLDAEGRVPMEQLLHLAQNLPEDSLELILDNLRLEGLIEGDSGREIMRLNRELARRTPS